MIRDPRIANGIPGPAGPAGAAGDWKSAQTTLSKSPPYTIANGDIGAICLINNAGTITIDSSSSMVAGQKIDFISFTGTNPTFAAAAGSGITLTGTPGLKLRSFGSAATLVCLSATLYVIMGDLIA